MTRFSISPDSFQIKNNNFGVFGGLCLEPLYVDYASGIKDSRSGLIAALNYLHKGDCLVVWKLDRLGRSLSELLRIIKSLKEKEIGFKSLTENIDTTTPQGELYFISLPP